MDTVLNVGINDDIAMQLSQEIGPRFAYDTYARFLMSYGITVMGEDPKMYLDIIRVYDYTFFLNYNIYIPYIRITLKVNFIYRR